MWDQPNNWSINQNCSPITNSKPEIKPREFDTLTINLKLNENFNKIKQRILQNIHDKFKRLGVL